MENLRTSFRADALRLFAEDICLAVGCGQDDAVFLSQVIVSSDLAGHPSHGLRRLIEYADDALSGEVDPTAHPSVVSDRGSTVVLDGRRAVGHLAMRDVVRLVVERAKGSGISAVAMRNSDYVGRFADHCAAAAAEGVILLCFANDSGAGQDVAAPGSTEARIATNPIAAGVPRSAAPHLVLDLATSVVAAGRLAEEQDRGATIPAEWVTPDGALRPVGGVKGFALALLVEALAGSLSGAGTVRGDVGLDRGGQGVLAIGIDPRAFRDLLTFTEDVDGFLGHLAGSPMPADQPRVRAPGEASEASRARGEADGIALASRTVDRLIELAERLHVEHEVLTTRDRG